MQPSGFRAFLIVWVGQFVSLVGSAMTRFALTIWAYDETGSALALSLVAFFAFGPMIIVTPFAGALVDRWNRKTVMIASDLGAGLSTVVLLLLSLSGNLQIWHIYVVTALGGISEAFQFPAFSAAVTMMIKKENYARAHGLQSLAQSASTVAAPMLAGMLLVAAGLEGVMMVDIITFLVAVSTLAIVHIPHPKSSTEGTESKGSLLKETKFGFTYILDRPSLLGMQMMFFLANLFGTAAMVLVAPMVLARTDNNEVILGSVQMMMGVGGVVGGLLLGIWGGPKRRVHGVFLGMFATSIFGEVVFGLGDGLVIWAIGGFFISFFIPILNGSNQAIWQAKVAPDLQGRVFAVRRLIAQITAPVAMLLSGWLADYIFEPAMVPGGSLADVFGGIVGTGPGAGIALIFIFSGLLGAASGLLGYAIPMIRDIEDILPDYIPEEQPPAAAEVVAAVQHS